MTAVKFQCIRSGNFVQFTNSDDIEGLRKHEGYREVKDEEIKVEKAPEKVLTPKRGRPKQEVPSFLQE